ncbi:MAG: hypothetical protein HGA45_25530 [Chloroflexales bacterium]|nr:hypothetical protein [Chloroflexales bacterium]
MLSLSPLLLIWLSPVGEWFGRLWRRSPPGRLAQRLWDLTPAGQRRLQSMLRVVRLRLDNRSEYARSWCQGARSANARLTVEPLFERLTRLDRERTEALRTLRGRPLLASLERLAVDYEELGRDGERLCPRRSPKGPARGAGVDVAVVASDTAYAQPSPASSDSVVDWGSGGYADPGSPSSDGGPW